MFTTVNYIQEKKSDAKSLLGFFKEKFRYLTEKSLHHLREAQVLPRCFEGSKSDLEELWYIVKGLNV